MRMDAWQVATVVSFLFVLLLLYLLHRVTRSYHRLLKAKRSDAVRHGLAFEQLFPFAAHYPFDPTHFRFLGKPVDGISFEEDELVFIEFKTGTSRLSAVQRHVRDLIKEKKVSWREIRAS
ncbi:hypothetical protein AUJ68_00060 [Candidatus Woesearchaeota archaeon CG1_02_57_44]|nr:MAG: hypothetical protein AUJ68_00060 [Candidatus Woesearchaeota archaeon CG1_02_57_44]PIN68307.1 MAG: hypothetical protein COV94_05420 [Candidatus Woesearchaeota archaeon CG11_big_fil_rev_8_21_14_0_20_57_5]